MPFWAQNSQENIRRTQYAGSWYDNNPGRLKQELDNFLSRAQCDPDQRSAARLYTGSLPISGDVLAVIVPHAGYMFSGQTAAFSFKAAQKTAVKRVFLLGPSHYAGFQGAALPEATSFATPLGNLEVDSTVVSELKTYPMFSIQGDVHGVEHSLELQLPFIKYCFGEVKIIPIVIGHLNDESEARVLGEILKGTVKKGDLIVVSSDFTHYGPRYEYMPFGNSDNIPDQVGRLDGQAFQFLSRMDLDGFAEFLRNTSDTICGMFPIEVLLSMLPRGCHGTLLKYMTSRDTILDDSQNSVSYLAVAFSGQEWPEKTEKAQPASDVVQLTETERRALFNLARQTMEAYVREKRVINPDEIGITITDTMKECFGVFVTLTRKAPAGVTQEHNELRGCIGNIYPSRPLYKAVQENAISAACRDHRFMPVAPSELSELDVELSILTPPRRVGSYKDIVIGRDGVILTKGRHQAVFLPQVAVEWGWGLDEMLTQLSLKAELRPNDWREGANFDVFQSEKIRIEDEK